MFILLAIREYLAERGVVARVYCGNNDIDDDTDWLIHDCDELDKLYDESLLAHFNGYETRIQHIDPNDPNCILIHACKVRCKDRLYIKTIAVDINDVNCFQFLYEFVTSRS